MELLIREISAEDAQAVHLLSQQLGYELSVADTAAQIKEVLSRKDNYALVAVVNETIVGWIHAFKAIRIETKPFIEIGGLVVDEQYRSRGVGKKLVTRIKEWCAEQEIHSLRVRSNTKRSEAHQFYTRLGFTEKKEQKVFEMMV
jgi:GNAT superfamily N-acetyltransferase